MASGRTKRIERVIPGRFTPAEMAAAFASQDAGTRHPRVSDVHWATISERWAALPQVWGRGPWLDRSELSVGIRTGLGIHGRLYRVTRAVWGLELEGTPTGEGVHRGTLEEMVAHALGHWPAPTEAQRAEGAALAASHERHVEAQAQAVAQAAASAERGRAKLLHRGERAASTWLRRPTRGHVSFAALAAFAGPPPLVEWDGFQQGEPMSKEQRRAAEAIVRRAAALEASLGAALLADERESCEDASWTRSRSPRELMGRIALTQLQLTGASHAGSAYVWASFEDTWRAEHGLAAILHDGRVVAMGGSMDVEIPSGAPQPIVGGRLDAAGALTADAWAEEPFEALVAFPWWKGWPGSWRVSFTFEDSENELTEPQRAAARHLAEGGRALREALLARLRASHARKARRPPASAEALRRLIQAGRIRVLAEDREGLAYTVFSLRAAWRAHESATLVAHGTRVVGLTVRAKLEEVVDADMEAELAARRAARR